MQITNDMLSSEISKATKKAFLELFKNGEKYYYCVLVTTGEAHSPFVSAWSQEALKREADKLDSREDAKFIKWSYADSPYMCFGEEYFKKVDELFNQLPVMDYFLDEKEWMKRYNFRLNAMELALKQVADEGIFALNQPREDVYLNVEVTPPDRTNTERAMRLNKAENIKVWLDEMSE
jgi:hypothetical protein